ncbi:MAG TPA: hypothetical protein VGE72_13125 [Azospirillum sp.]
MAVHDFTTPARRLGHDCVFLGDDGARLRLAGCGGGVRAGDTLVIDRGRHTRHVRVLRIAYEPGSVWTADVEETRRYGKARAA